MDFKSEDAWMAVKAHLPMLSSWAAHEGTVRTWVLTDAMLRNV